MKIDVTQEKIHGNAANQSGSFSIAGNIMAFQILSSGIYKHKIRAVVRELVCNCVDAHMLNDQQKPFLVFAPNSMNSSFSVRDFGPGLSEKSMYEVYTQYFNSTKTGNEIGGFGLGAKSPFSYTDTFSVKSYYDGVLSVYNMYIDNGAPKILKTYEGPFEEGDSTGVEVIVPVDPKDVLKWHEEIKNIMSPFKKSQYLIKGYDLTINSFEDIEGYNDNHFKINTNNYSKINAIYGNIVYPITLNVKTTWLKTNLKLMVHFDMNTLRPQPSREELQHDEVTVKNIEERFENLNKKVKNEIVEKLSTMKGFRKITRFLRSLTEEQRTDLWDDGILVDGHEILYYTKGFDFHHYVDFFNQNVSVFSMSNRTLRSKPLREANYYSRSFYNISSVFGLHQHASYILINDIDKHVRQTITSVMLDNNNIEFLCVVHKDNDVQKVIDMVKQIMKDDEVVILKASDFEEKRLKYFPKKEKTSSDVRPTTPSAKVYTFSDKCWTYKDEYYSANEISELNGFCVGLYNNKICLKSSNFSDLYSFDIDFVKLVCKYYGITEFYAVRTKYHKKALENENLKCFYSEILKIFANKIDVSKMVAFKFKKVSGIDSIRSRGCEKFYEHIHPSLTEYDKKVYEAIDYLDYLPIFGERTKHDDYIVYENAKNFIKTQTESAIVKARDFVEMVYSRFPLIENYILHSNRYNAKCGKQVDQILKDNGLI